MLVKSVVPGPIELVAVGHLTSDRVSGRAQLGGAAAFASLTAARLGLRAAVVSSIASDFPYFRELEGIEIHCIEAERTTEFENLYERGERRQRVLSQAAPLVEECLGSIRARLAEDAIVLYCPVVHEVQVPLVRLARRGLCAVAPQGFFRRWNGEGVVASADWTEARAALSRVDVVVTSEEDHVAPEELAEGFPGRAFVVTQGSRGARVYSGSDVYDVPAFPARETDPTGAGDVFAAAFLVALRERKSLIQAARFACAAASFAVEAPGVTGIPSRTDVEHRLMQGRS